MKKDKDSVKMTDSDQELEDLKWSLSSYEYALSVRGEEGDYCQYSVLWRKN